MYFYSFVVSLKMPGLNRARKEKKIEKSSIKLYINMYACMYICQTRKYTMHKYVNIEHLPAAHLEEHRGIHSNRPKLNEKG